MWFSDARRMDTGIYVTYLLLTCELEVVNNASCIEANNNNNVSSET